MNYQRLMRLAFEAAAFSPDPSTQNGAILAKPNGRPIHTTSACNEFPGGVRYLPERWERPLKYEIIEHAERNAIYAAARQGIATEGLVLICPWAACSDCARAIIQAHLAELVTLEPTKGATHQRWDASIATAMTLLEEAGVKVTFIDSAPFSEYKLRRNGEIWSPC